MARNTYTLQGERPAPLRPLDTVTVGLLVLVVIGVAGQTSAFVNRQDLALHRNVHVLLRFGHGDVEGGLEVGCSYRARSRCHRQAPIGAICG